MNPYLHIWFCDDTGDRERNRRALWADPEWLACTVKCATLGALERHENCLTTLVPFFLNPLHVPPAGG